MLRCAVPPGLADSPTGAKLRSFPHRSISAFVLVTPHFRPRRSRYRWAFRLVTEFHGHVKIVSALQWPLCLSPAVHLSACSPGFSGVLSPGMVDTPALALPVGAVLRVGVAFSGTLAAYTPVVPPPLWWPETCPDAVLCSLGGGAAFTEKHPASGKVQSPEIPHPRGGTASRPCSRVPNERL